MKLLLITLAFLFSAFSSRAQDSLSIPERVGFTLEADAYVKGYDEAAHQVAVMKSKFILFDRKVLTEKRVLQLYNDAWGAKFGNAKTIAEARKLVNDYGFRYMENQAIAAVDNYRKRRKK